MWVAYINAKRKINFIQLISISISFDLKIKTLYVYYSDFRASLEHLIRYNMVSKIYQLTPTYKFSIIFRSKFPINGYYMKL